MKLWGEVLADKNMKRKGRINGNSAMNIREQSRLYEKEMGRDAAIRQSLLNERNRP